MSTPFINESFGIVAVLVTVPAIIFTLEGHSRFAKFFSIVPPLIFAYFIPTLLSNTGFIPKHHETYSYIKTFILPASLLLLTLSVDIKGIFKLGYKAIIMLLAATASIVIGGPIAFFLFKSGLPDEAWKGFAAIAGSWIGGTANFIAVGNSVGASDSIMGMMVIIDVCVAYIWIGVLLYLAGRENSIDKLTGADNRSIVELKNKIVHFQEETKRVATTKDYMVMVSLAFLCTYIASKLGNYLPELGSVISHGTWKIILITTFGVILSFTPMRDYEGAGASKIGTMFLYILIGTIGANADVSKVFSYPYLFFTALLWITIHALIIFIIMRLIKAPLFFMAVGSMANIGGAASASIVASAFHPALATVGVMMGIAGYVLGTYCALICAALIHWMSLM